MLAEVLFFFKLLSSEIKVVFLSIKNPRGISLLVLLSLIHNLFYIL